MGPSWGNAKRQLISLFSAPNCCGEFDNAGAMMEVDAELRCSFWVLKPAVARLEASGLLQQSGAAFEQEEAAEERFRPPTPPKRPG